MKKIDRIQKVRTRMDELEVMSRLKNSVEWSVFKRLAARYIGHLRRVSFKLTEENPSYLAVRHAEFAGEALGIKTMIKMVDKAGEKLERLEEDAG